MSDYSPQSFKFLPPVVKNLLIINVIFYMAMLAMRGYGIDLNAYLALHPLGIRLQYPSGAIGQFHIWQLVTYMFMHASFDHIFFNMFALWMFGYVLENYWGSRRFLFYYFFCGIGAAIVNLIVPGWGSTVGASGAVYGILLAFGMMFPNERIYLYFIMPIKAKWFVIGYAVIELLSGLHGGDTIAHFAHLGGMLFGLLLILYWRKHPFSRF